MLRILKEPLFGEARFYGNIRSFAEADIVFVGSSFDQNAQLAQFFNGLDARFEAVETSEILPRQLVQRSVWIQDIDDRELVPQADFVVRLVMRGSHLEHAGAELELHRLVANDRQRCLIFDRERTPCRLPDQVSGSVGPADSRPPLCRP